MIGWDYDSAGNLKLPNNLSQDKSWFYATTSIINECVV